jgi:acyl transferase domain-containing protein
MVVLKPLDQALKDNDIIRSVIVGSGINQDGKTSGITMPNGAAQGILAFAILNSVVECI